MTRDWKETQQQIAAHKACDLPIKQILTLWNSVLTCVFVKCSFFTFETKVSIDQNLVIMSHDIGSIFVSQRLSHKSAITRIFDGFWFLENHKIIPDASFILRIFKCSKKQYNFSKVGWIASAVTNKILYLDTAAVKKTHENKL